MVHGLFTTRSPSTSPPVLSRWAINDFDDRRVCFSPNTRGIALYVAGILFGIGWWGFICALIYPAIDNHKDNIFSAISFEDYICGILSTIGMIIASSVDRSILNDGVYLHSTKVLWKARLLLFLGFTLLACGLCGSVAVFVFKYTLDGMKVDRFYFGIAIIAQNACIMISSIALLISQRYYPKYDYLL
ncbi:24415_t:CDS:2 [Cetraspora pellucida]|uniref:24415_t:CDS:1 n=1 Tax=Cetraspora pellucida TaxID=1433469 RepID=A0A9N9BNG0_9GLOM|nr:24415_t:CDS:2 [Cetraspora pellucida]